MLPHQVITSCPCFQRSGRSHQRVNKPFLFVPPTRRCSYTIVPPRVRRCVENQMHCRVENEGWEVLNRNRQIVRQGRLNIRRVFFVVFSRTQVAALQGVMNRKKISYTRHKKPLAMGKEDLFRFLTTICTKTLQHL